MPAVAQRRPGGSIGAVFGPGVMPIRARREATPVDASLQHGADSASSPALRDPLRARPSRAAPRANGTGLPDRLKAGVEAMSGFSMDDVRVHYNSPRPAQLQALAFTQGADIHVGPGQERHLPHEAWHVAQQKQGRVRATLQTQGVAINDDSALEREADRIGARAAQPGALALSPGCGCATCANGSGVPGGGAHRILPAAPPNQIGQRFIIQKAKCPKCDTPVKSKQTECPGCGYKMPATSASAAPSKSNEGAAPKAKAAKDKGKPAEAKPAATNSVRIQLQLEHPKEVDMAEIVEHDDGTPITQEEAIAALNKLLAKAKGAKGVTQAIWTAAYQEVGPKVVTKIKQGAIAQSASTYFNSGSSNAKERRNRIDVENMRGAGNFSPAARSAAAGADAAAAAPAAAAGAAAPAAAAAADD